MGFWYIVVDKALTGGCSSPRVPSERSGLGTRRCSEARTQGTKDLKDLPPAPRPGRPRTTLVQSTLEMLPLDGALAHLRPTAWKTRRVPVRTRQLAKGKSNRSSFPQAPPRARGCSQERAGHRGHLSLSPFYFDWKWQ